VSLLKSPFDRWIILSSPLESCILSHLPSITNQQSFWAPDLPRLNSLNSPVSPFARHVSPGVNARPAHQPAWFRLHARGEVPVMEYPSSPVFFVVYHYRDPQKDRQLMYIYIDVYVYVYMYMYICLCLCLCLCICICISNVVIRVDGCFFAWPRIPWICLNWCWSNTTMSGLISKFSDQEVLCLDHIILPPVIKHGNWKSLS
jgi:hypothetical protein